MNATCKKNLNLLKSLNLSLYNKIESGFVQNHSYEFKINLAGEYNLLIDSMPVHSVTGAQEEAKNIFNTVKNDTKNVIHVIYGFGMGYLADYFAQNALGSVIIFEKDISLLKFLFENADFSSLFSRDDCYIVSDFSELQEAFTHLFKFKKEALISAIDYYKTSPDFIDFTKKFNAFLAKQNYNYNFQSSTMYGRLYYMIERLDEKINLSDFKILKNAYKNKPAIIVSAGPSLNENIEELRKNCDNALIFSVGTALRTLCSNGIKPDFVNYLETFECSHQFEGLDLSEINLVTEPSANPNLLDYKFKNKFLTCSHEANVNHLFSELAGKEQDYFEAKGTVAYHALYCAKYLGCNPIILLGQDLAYTNGKCYSQGTVYEDIDCRKKENGEYEIVFKNREKLKIVYFPADSEKASISDEGKEKEIDNKLRALNSQLCFVKGISGEILPTSLNFKLFCSYFGEFSKTSPDLRLINASSGAYLNGFEHTKLTNLELTKINKQIPIIEDKYCSRQIIRSNLQRNINFLKEYHLQTLHICALLNQQKIPCEQIKSLVREMNEKRTVNTTLRLLTLSAYNEISYDLREFDSKLHMDTEKYLNYRAKLCFNYINNRIEIIVEKLEKVLENLNEDCAAKS